MEKDQIVQEVLKRLDGAASGISGAAQAGFAEAVRYVAISGACWGAAQVLMAVAFVVIAKKCNAIGVSLPEHKWDNDGKTFLTWIAPALCGIAAFVCVMAATNNVAISLAPKGYLVMKLIEGVAK